MLLFCCGLLLFPRLISTYRVIKTGTCITPDGYEGTCENIKNCSFVSKLITNTRDKPEFKRYLAGLHCGEEGSDPMVCCFKSESDAKENVDESYDNTNKSEKFLCRGTNVTQNMYIFGGKNAEVGEFPWVVALGYYGYNSTKLEFLCGGALITQHWVVTAKHCVTLDSHQLVIARLGDFDLADEGQDGAKHIDVPILEVLIEDSIDDDTSFIGNDIAIVKLWRPKVDQNITPICTLKKDQDSDTFKFYSNTLPIAIGWGERGTSRKLTSNILQKADFNVISTNDCRKMFHKRNLKASFINERVICASGSMANACRGDSGSPLMVILNHTMYLAGVVSHGPVCGEKDLPTIFTKVSNHPSLLNQAYN